MKPNLTDFPKVKDYGTCEEWSFAVDNWRRDFEAALRALLKEQEDFFKGRNTKYRLATDVLKEVLGDP